MSDLTCTKCGAALQQNDFNLDLGVARCSFCRAWTRIGEPQPEKLESEVTRIKRDVSKPDKFEVNEHHGVLHVTWRWFNWGVAFLIPFCLFWDGFLVVWYTAAIGFGGEMGGFAIIPLLFPVLHVAVGVGLTYYTAALLVNRTTIMVGGHRLSIKHGPIPWKGAELNDTDDIDQLYCEEKVNRGKNGTSYSYIVKAKTFSGGEQKLISNVDNIQEALYLEQLIEKFLGIEDRRVAGEVSP